ncbi:MAG: hypothetical protein CME31_19875 [Gimesia sp.]|uniref:Uncharacterized protein n=1 Tax=Gimesia maris TaxID=122 RepID=A0A3D3REF6_9PLAN|nr:hypothetical protein [Gimesia sp.]HCO27214.1 hypothetical protein [Gimesia maris]
MIRIALKVNAWYGKKRMNSDYYLYLVFAVYILISTVGGVLAIYMSCRKDFAKKTHTKYQPQSRWLTQVHRVITFVAGLILLYMALHSLLNAEDIIDRFRQVR